MLQGNAMSDAGRITEIAVVTESAKPLTATLRLVTATAVMQFELTEEFALELCRQLERFLTR
jgi:hypothetical protein